MSELIETAENENGDIIVSGRDLHYFLGIKTRYDKWFERMAEYGFVENMDYIAIAQKRPTAQGNETTYTDHHLKLDMAKEISMLQRTEKGKQARLYFIEIEKRWNDPDAVIKRAQQILQNRVNKLMTTNLVLEQQVNEFKPKATYYDMVLQNKSLLSVLKIAKDYGMSATKMNKKLNDLGVQYKQGDIWLLYAKYQDKGYTQTATYVTNAESSKVSTKWTQKGRLFLYEILKNNGILPMIEKKENNLVVMM